MGKKSLRDILFYKYKLVGEVEKDGKVYAKYKRIPRLGGLLFILNQAFRIILIAVLAALLSYVLINTIFSEKRPGPRQMQK